MAKHVNDGNCAKCLEILVGVEPRLLAWFKTFQTTNNDAHVAWGARGEKDQNDALKKGTSKAKWGESPHNFVPPLAIDLFRLTLTGAEWPASWFNTYVGPDVAKTADLEWGGTFPKFRDAPHVQIRNWKDLVASGKAKLPTK